MDCGCNFTIPDDVALPAGLLARQDGDYEVEGDSGFVSFRVRNNGKHVIRYARCEHRTSEDSSI